MVGRETQTHEEAQPGGFDPTAWLLDMYVEGSDAAVLHPSIGLNFWDLKDRGAAVPLA